MSIPPQFFKIISGSVPLRPILVVSFVLEILAVVGLTGYISFLNGQKAVNYQSQQLRDEVTERVEEHLNDYFSEADQITKTTTDAFQTGLLDTHDLPAIGRFFWNQVRQRNVSFINYGLKTGEYAGAGSYTPDGRNLVISETSAKTDFKSYDYATDHKGNRIGLPEIVDYEFRNELWYQEVIKSGQATWTKPYTWDDVATIMSLAIARPIYNQSGQLIGAMSVDLSLDKISNFLRQIKISPTGKLLILDHQGKIVASSSAKTPFKIVEGKVEQIKSLDSSDLDTRSASQYLIDKFNNFQNIKNTHKGEFYLDHQRYFIQVTPWKDQVGLSLLIVIIMPESDFMGIIQRNTHLTIIVCMIALIISILVSFILATYIINPIRVTVAAADLLSQGKWKTTLPQSWIKELDSLRNSFNKMSEQLQMSFDSLEYTAYHDALTQLPNQLFFRKTLEERIICDQTQPELFAVFFLDLDFFKLVNDSFGHLAGDALLVQVARRLQKCVRRNDLVARFGGDEFVILLDRLNSHKQAVDVAVRICKALQKSFKINNNEVFINTSIGIVFSDLCPMSAEDLLKNADISLYHSKSNGKGRYTIFNHQMSLDSQKRLSLETDLRRALARKEIEVHYQPIVNIAKKQIVGFEALMRWRHAKLGLISPEIFIPIAEETGLISELGWWTARQACEQLKRWQNKYPECTGMKINVNFSAKQFFEPDFVEQIEKILEETKIQSYNLSVEVTESLFIKYTDVMRDKLIKLNDIGVKISLDDFGVGYSCLSYVKDFTIDILKIDRSFTSNITENSRILAIIEAIILLANQLEIEIIAEGIETQEQLETVYCLGCKQGQGYWFSEPLKAQQCDRLLDQFLANLRGNLAQEKVSSFFAKFNVGA